MTERIVHFVHEGAAYLPELAAYQDFLRAHNAQGLVHQTPLSVPHDARFVWWMCGRVPQAHAQRFPQAWQVHEYASASVPPMAWAKDIAKRWTQARPHYRIFQNAWVRQRFAFDDGVPCELRDMGVPDAAVQPWNAPASAPLHDFVYLGEMRRLTRFVPVLDAIRQAGWRLLLIGDMPLPLQNRLLQRGGTTYTGRVAQQDVPHLLRTAHCGLNLVPQQLPFTQQTSTKLLEYCAAGLRVVSTDYAWARQFAQQRRAHLTYLDSRATAPASHIPALEQALQARCALPAGTMAPYAWSRIVERMPVWRQMGLLS